MGISLASDQRSERRAALLEIGCHSLDQFRLPLGKEVVGARDDAQVLRLGDAGEPAHEFVFRPVLVALALHDEFVFRAGGERVNGQRGQRHARADQLDHARIRTAERERDPRAEREATECERNARKRAGEIVERRAHILTFAAAMIVAPVLRPTPRKLKRSVGMPRSTSACAMRKTALVCIVPP